MIGDGAGNTKKDIRTLHELGHLAVHVTASPSEVFFEKIDDRRIINNLREDGGTTQREREGHQLYPIISATVLPPSQFPVRQNLFDKAFKIFVGLDMEKSLIKGYSPADAYSAYTTNKKGRPSYKAGLIFDDLANSPSDERLEKVDRSNFAIARAHTLPKKSKLFGVKPPDFHRVMNEVVLKITDQSMKFIGASAASIAENPSVLLDLICLQKKLKERSGITYPIQIYVDRGVLALHFVDGMSSAATNQLFELKNIESTLQNLIEMYPNTVPVNYGSLYDTEYEQIATADCLKMLGYKMGANQELHRLPEVDQQEKRQSVLQQVQVALTGFKLPKPSEQDNFVQIHHPDRALSEQYLEVNQEKLKAFVKNKVMGLGINDVLTKDQESVFNAFVKAYNAQFRLNVYKELLSTSVGVNYPNIEADVKWAATLAVNLQPHLQQTKAKAVTSAFDAHKQSSTSVSTRVKEYEEKIESQKSPTPLKKK